MTIVIRDKMFKPPIAHAKPAQRVWFLNNDDLTHTITFEDPSVRSLTLNPNDHYNIAFEKPGEFKYHSDGMTGTVLVEVES